MRCGLFACLTLAFSTGCTNQYLRQSVVNQASTLTELQYQQVLGNLAMMSLDPSALPSHANLRNGSAQIQDAGIANLVAFTSGSQTLPGVTGSRTVVEQWGVIPVTEKVELQLISVAYRRALGIGASVDVKLANDIAHEVCDQISNSDDINLLSDPTVNNQLLKAIIEPQAEDFRVKLLDRIDALDRAKAEAKKNPAKYGPDVDFIGKQIQELRDSFSRTMGEDVATTATALANLRLSANDETLVSDRDNLADLDIDKIVLSNPDYDPSAPDGTRAHEPTFVKLASPVTREARRKVKEAIEDVETIPSDWFAVGGKRDIPRNARYVGRFHDRYAWVCPGVGCHELAEFTAKILDFADLIKDRSVLTVTGGPQYAPSGNR